MSVAGGPEGPAAEEYDLRLFRPVDLRRHIGEYPPRTLCEVSRAGPKEASPTAAIIDSQSVKSAEKGGPASIRRVTMRARSDNEDLALRSRARSGIFSLIH